jgi:hypothetical protein
LHDFFSSSRDSNFVERIRANTSRYIGEFSRVIDDKIPPPSVTFDQDSMSPEELMMQQRRFNQQ